MNNGWKKGIHIVILSKTCRQHRGKQRYQSEKSKKGKDKWKSDKWRGNDGGKQDVGPSSSKQDGAGQNQNHEKKKNYGNKKKVDRKTVQCYNCKKDGKPAYISNVLYAPKMKNNLLRLGKLLESGYSMSMEGNGMKVFDSRRQLVLKAPMSSNRTFKVEIQAADQKCFQSIDEIGIWTWHQRYGHLNF